MTEQEIRSRVKAVLDTIVPSAGGMAGVPVDTGRLVSSIKIRQTDYGFDVYIDTGGMTLEQWYNTPEEQRPSGVAPYAGKVNEQNPFWRRLAVLIHDRLRAELGGEFTTNYDSGRTMRGDL